MMTIRKRFENLVEMHRWLRRMKKKHGLRLRYDAKLQADGRVDAVIVLIPSGQPDSKQTVSILRWPEGLLARHIRARYQGQRT